MMAISLKKVEYILNEPNKINKFLKCNIGIKEIFSGSV
jgi:hypothetical protein